MANPISEELCRLALPEEVTDFENNLKTMSKIEIICGPCLWSIHTDLFKAHIKPQGPFLQIIDQFSLEDKQLELRYSEVFTFARMLQFIYYGTYSYRADDTIQPEANVFRPGHPGCSPATIVHSGLLDPDNPEYSTLKAFDDTLSQDFGHDIHLGVYKLARMIQIPRLAAYALKRYSEFPFKNHRNFYHSVADNWPHFPMVRYDPDREAIIQAILPHLARFWSAARGNVLGEPAGIEGGRIVKWIKKRGRAQRQLRMDLMDFLAGVDSGEGEEHESSTLSAETVPLNEP